MSSTSQINLVSSILHYYITMADSCRVACVMTQMPFGIFQWFITNYTPLEIPIYLTQ